jgi:hypothetical protein
MVLIEAFQQPKRRAAQVRFMNRLLLMRCTRKITGLIWLVAFTAAVAFCLSIEKADARGISADTHQTRVRLAAGRHSPYKRIRTSPRRTVTRRGTLRAQPVQALLENKSIAMKFDKQKGHLLSFVDKKRKTQLLSHRQGAWPVIFGLGYKLGNGDSLWTDSNRASRFSDNLYRIADGIEFQGNWTFNWGNDRALVTVKVYLPDDSSFSKWKIRVQMYGNASLDRVAVPMLAGIGKLGNSAEDDRLLVPDQSGRLFINPSEKLRHWGQQYPSGFANMQFMAYYDKQAGFYLSSLDSKGLSKDLSWDRQDKAWAAWAIAYRGLAGTGNAKSFETEGLLGVFYGDWTEAASIYREWAKKQPWAESTIRRKGTPVWLTKIGIGKDYYAHESPNKTYVDWTEKIKDHSAFFKLPTLAMLWGWEHGGTWASGDYFPPQEGWNAFDAAIGQINSTNAHPYVFIRAEAVKTNSPAWNSNWGQQAALRGLNGQPVGGQNKLMCLECDEWLAHLKETIKILAEHDVGLVQLDGFPWVTLRTCYGKGHRHGPVPGCGARPYEVAQNLLILRKQLKNGYPDLALSGEGGAELYLPVLDVLHSRDCWAEVTERGKVGSRLAEVVPLFHFIYHEHIIFVDQYNLGLWRHLGGLTYHNLAVGRCFIWGEICSYNMQDWFARQGNQPVFTLLQKCAEARAGFLNDFLIFGRMLPPPETEAPFIDVESEARKFKGKVPGILSSAWLSEQGDVAVIVLNIGLQPLRTSLSLSKYKTYIRSDSKMEVYSNNELVQSTCFDGNQSERTIELNPLEFTAFILRSTNMVKSGLTKHASKGSL